MAKIVVQGEYASAEIVNLNEDCTEEPRYVYRCDDCCDEGTDRGNFEDTIQAAEMHVDRAHD